MFRNVASQKVALFAFDITTGAPKTGDSANITPYVAKDYGTVTVLGTTTATEMDSTNAKGWYSFVLTQGETNADALLFTAKSSTSNVSIVGALIFPDPANYTKLVVDAAGLADANAVKVGPTGAGTAQTARDIGASVLLASGQKVDVDTIKTNPVVNAGTVTFPTGATLASTTNITAGTITTVTNLTNAPTAGDLTAAMKTSVTTAATAATPTAAAVTGNVGGNVVGTVASVVGAVGSVTGAVGSVTGNVGGNVVGTVASVVGAVGSVTGLTASNLDATVSSRLASASYTAPDNADILLIKAKTDNLPSDPADASDIAGAFSTVNSTLATIAGYVDTEIGTLQTTATAIKAKTDSLVFTSAGKIDANILAVNGTTVTGSGTSGSPWGP